MLLNKIQKPLGIVCAMDEELSDYLDCLQNYQKYKIGNTYFYCGNIGNNDVVICKCGEGKVCAAHVTQLLISNFGPYAVINTGCAGSLSQELNSGDIFIGNKVGQWDYNLSALGYKRGLICSTNNKYINCSPSLTNKILYSMKHKYKAGLIVSGDTFVADYSTKNNILYIFKNAMCVDMEAGAIGFVCYQNNIPFCIIKCISDNGNNKEYKQKKEIICSLSAKILLDSLKVNKFS